LAPPTSRIDQQNTHRLIPTRFADGGASVLTELTGDDDILAGIFSLDNATNDRLWAESGRSPGIDARELVFGIPAYRIINATFCHPAPNGSRFNSRERGAWYAGFELETSQAEITYHRRLWLAETGWNEEDVSDYVDYLADFHAEFYDLRTGDKYTVCLSSVSYKASQVLAEELLEIGAAGIVYPSVRREGGTCLACFRPVLVGNVRRGDTFNIVFRNLNSEPTIQRCQV
jgi:hypothetical protein